MGYHSLGTLKPLTYFYESRPEGNGPFPTIVLMMHAYGFDDPMRKVCDDLAKAGYLAVGADSYLNGMFEMQTRSETAIMTTLDLVLELLKRRTDVDHDRMGVMGFCMGGRHTYLANVFHDDFKAAVAFYGFPHRGEDAEHTPQNLIDKFHGPVLSIFGSEDQGIPPEAIKAYQDATETKGSLHRSKVYQGAGHGFLNPYSPHHHPEASEDAWKMTIDFFNQYVK